MQPLLDIFRSRWNSQPQSTFFEYCSRDGNINAKGQERFARLRDLVKSIAAKSSAPEDIILLTRDAKPLECFAEALYYDELNQKIYISYLLLLEPEDLPPWLLAIHKIDQCDLLCAFMPWNKHSKTSPKANFACLGDLSG